MNHENRKNRGYIPVKTKPAKTLNELLGLKTTTENKNSPPKTLSEILGIQEQVKS